MRIIVTSDSHKRTGILFEIVEKHLNDADLFINLGDGEDDVDSLLLLYPDLKIERVCGNCDWYSTLPLFKTIKAGNKTIFFTHGHHFNVKMGYERIIQRAVQEHADICLFGHTHNPFTQYIDGIQYMNPGAVCNSSYGIIDITDNGIMAFTVRVTRLEP